MKTSLTAVEYTIVDDLVEKHGVSKSTAYKWFKKNKLPKGKFNKKNSNKSAYQLWRWYTVHS